LKSPRNGIGTAMIEGSFGANVDYAMLVKIYGADPTGEKRYSPAECIGAVKHRVEGNPDPKHVSTRASSDLSESDLGFPGRGKS